MSRRGSGVYKKVVILQPDGATCLRHCQESVVRANWPSSQKQQYHVSIINGLMLCVGVGSKQWSNDRPLYA